MGAIDVHAHYVSPSALAEARRDGNAYGVRVHDDPAGDVIEFLHSGVRVRPIFRELRDLEIRQSYMREERIQRQVISTWTDLLPADMPREQSQLWIRLQNDTLIEDSAVHGDHFSPMGTLPLHDVQAALEELRYLVEDRDVRAVELITSVNDEDLDSSKFRPLWRAIAERGVFVLLHPPRCPIETPRADDYFLNNLVFFPVDTTIAAAKLIFSGVLSEFPGLKICLPHGGGFLPYQIGRFDHGFDVHPACHGAIDLAPSAHLRNFYYDTITHDDAALRYLIDRVGADRVLYGTDYPFEMTDDVGTERFRSLADISEIEIEQIAHLNADSLLSPHAHAQEPH